MKLTNKNAISQWAYEQCKKGNDTKEIRNLINDDCWICNYCYYIKDRKEMWSKLSNEYWSYVYCFYIRNRQSIRKNITDKNYTDTLKNEKNI